MRVRERKSEHEPAHLLKWRFPSLGRIEGEGEPTSLIWFNIFPHQNWGIAASGTNLAAP